ncbi:IQ calmodulin-binding motif family [Cryptosporidium sp. chipmunk genotype I]|uniref:IQ calmodulin-binding motif family n=1 Tax=Cryptosporidium sp. chipmunk genotype I TaxID=1280935 RepID=UPI00351A563F|nr:IQ calmodulin-binding motif family [Cryptosporidium sp. chipmunk genotype I]
MGNKRDTAFGFDTPITRGTDVVPSIGSVRSVVKTRNKNETVQDGGRWSIDSFGPLDYHKAEESCFGIHLVQKHENALINQTKERKLIVSSNYIQLIPKSKYNFLSNSKSKIIGVEKDLAKNFQIKEYMNDLTPIEKDQPNILVLQEQSDENVVQENKDKSMVPNIPFSLCISYFRQERNQICNKLQSVWRGYKTRSILRGSLQGLTSLKAKNSDGVFSSSGRIYLGYNIHKILLSIIDLYDLILDEESKVFQGSNTNNNTTSWLDAMYEQVGDFKTKYVLEVNNALQGNHGRKWLSDILNAREASKDILRKPRENKGLLPRRFETKYNEKILKSGLFYKSGKVIDRSDYITDQNISERRRVVGKRLTGENDANKSLEFSGNDFFTSIYVPYKLVKSNSLNEISTYLGIKTDQVLEMIQNKSVSKDATTSNDSCSGKAIGFNLTPGLGKMGEFTRDKTPSLDKTTPNTLRRGAGSNIYFTPNSLVHNSCKEDEQDCVEYYTPIQEFGDSMVEQSEYGNEYLENQGATYRIINQIKPKPYLKRKSKSILPSRATDIELDKVTSKIKELYKGKNPIEKKVLRKVSVSGGHELSGSRIPSISSTLNIVSDSPSSRNSSSKISRIPKYNGTISRNNALKSSQNSKGAYGTPQIIRSRYNDF